MFSLKDGRSCPSLESYIEISVGNLSVQCLALGIGGPDGKGLGSAGSDGCALNCRVRLLGNSMSRPPLQFQLHKKPSVATWSAQLGLEKRRGDVKGAFQPSEIGSRRTLYPVHHDLDSTLLLVEVF